MALESDMVVARDQLPELRVPRTVTITGLAGLALLAAASSIPATRSEIMASRYVRYSVCMHKALGKEWWKHSGVELGMNRWGVSEPTLATISRAPDQVVSLDRTCRIANEIEREPRPRIPVPEKNIPD